MPPPAAAGQMIKVMKPALKKLWTATKQAGKKVRQSPLGKKVEKGIIEARRKTVVRRRFAKNPKGGRPISRREGKNIRRTMKFIDSGKKPPPGDPLRPKWGSKYKNFEGRLPGQRGTNSPYKEYRVKPRPGETPPGATRIVRNKHSGETYYTNTHYGDQGKPHFIRIR